MEILNDVKIDMFAYNSFATIGFFDGFHIAHQKILEALVIDAKKNDVKSVVITFDDDILQLFKMTNSINRIQDKLDYLKKIKVDYVLVLSKKDKFMGLSAIDFVKKYLYKLNVKKIYCGSDFSFAKNKEGNKDFITNNTNIQIAEINDVYDGVNKISSTYIRNLLKAGKIEKVNSLISNPFSIVSIVINGKKLGRTIGFSTANIQITEQCKLLKYGVYFGKVIYENDEYKSMINVGTNPSVSNDLNLKIETHLLDFSKDLYNKEIKIIFLSYEREEIKFDNIDKLKEQLEKDKHKLIKMNIKK